MNALILGMMWGAFAATLGGWALARKDARLRDFRPSREREARLTETELRRGCCVLIACSLAVFVVGDRLSHTVKNTALPIAAIAASIWLRTCMRARSKAAEIKAEWPVLLEGMSAAALSGLDLISAFAAGVRRTSGPLREELGEALVRIAGGMSLSGALASLTKAAVPGADRLRSILMRCEVLGTPVAEVLESLALEASTTERLELEGRFNSLPLKLSIVTVIFLLPPVLIVSIAPHVLAFIGTKW